MPDQENERYSLTYQQFHACLVSAFMVGSKVANPNDASAAIWAAGQIAVFAPQPAPDAAVTEAAVRAAREPAALYVSEMREKALAALQRDPAGHLPIWEGYAFARSQAFVEPIRKVFEVELEAEVRRLLDAGESDVR